MAHKNKFNKLLDLDHTTRKERIQYALKELRELGSQVEKGFKSIMDLILLLEDHINILEDLLEKNNNEKGKQTAKVIAKAKEKK